MGFWGLRPPGVAQSEGRGGCEAKNEFSRFRFKMTSLEQSSKTTDQGGGKALEHRSSELRSLGPAEAPFLFFQEGG